MTQINVRVTRTDEERFDSYASEFGLDRTGLANLLLYRELRVGQLETLEKVRSRRGEVREGRLTAHLPETRWAEFVSHAKSYDLRPASAGAMIFLRELEEQWLRKAVDK
jgi:hypothetical protein